MNHSRRLRARPILSGLIAALIASAGALISSSAPAAAAAGDISTVVGGQGGTAPAPATTLAQSPKSVFATGNYVYIGDLACLRRIDLTTVNKLESLISCIPSPNNGITDITSDSSGNLYLALGSRIVKMSPGFDNQFGTGDDTLTTIAGTGSNGFNGDNQAATAAQVSFARGLDVDSANNLYIADTFNNRIRKVVPGADGVLNGGADETITTIAGTGTSGFSGDGAAATAATLNFPWAVDQRLLGDGSGEIFLSDQGNGRLRKVSVAAGGVIGNIATVASGLISPAGLDHDAFGNTFVANSFTQWGVVYKVDSGGNVTAFAGINGGGQQGFSGDGGPATAAKLNGPSDVSLDGAGNTYISDDINLLVRNVDPSGIINTLAGTGFASFGGDGGPANQAQIGGTASHVAFDSAGNLFLVDASNARIRRVTPGADGVITGASDEIITTVVGGGSPGDGVGDAGPGTAAAMAFNGSQGLVFDASGNLYFTTGNARIRKVVPGADGLITGAADEIITTIAGDGSNAYTGDNGPATAAEVSSPGGIALGPAGILVFIDSGNRRIRAINITSSSVTAYGVTIAPGNIATVGLDGTSAGFAYHGDGGPALSANSNAPSDLVVDSLGDLVFTDANGHIARKIDPSGIITTIVGTGNSSGTTGEGGPAAVAKLNSPRFLSLDASGHVFIGNTGRVLEIAGGIITRVAGNGTSGTSGDGGPATAAAILPGGLAFDGAGNLFIFGNSKTIRRVQAPISTPAPRYVAADFTSPGNQFAGDRKTDLSVFRPGSGTWYVNGVASPTSWGVTGDIPVSADYDGYGTSETAVYRPGSGTWYIKGYEPFTWGVSGDIPVPGDYNGDGRAEAAVYRPASGTWYIRGGATISWGGSPGDIPVPGDYDGNGTTDIAIYRPASGTWYIYGGSTTSWGVSGDMPVQADYDGNGTTDIAVYRPASGTWYVLGGATTSWGISTDVPVPGDYDGNGTADIAVFRDGIWYVNGGATTSFGVAGDTPLPKPVGQ